MRLCLVHTDLRLYWPARLGALQRFLGERESSLQVLEIAGLGSPYAFAGPRVGKGLNWWRCLFPNSPMESISPFRAAAAVQNALEEFHPDVVLAGAIAFPSGVGAVRWARARQKRVVIMDDVRVRDVPRNALVNSIKRRIYSNVDALFLPAPSHIPDYEFWGISRDKMFFGLNVVDNASYRSQAASVRAESDSWRAKLRLPRRFVLGVGRQVGKKNWAALLEAWRRFKTNSLQTQLGLVLVGNGPERPPLKALSETLQLDDVVFIDFLPPQEVTPFYALATALVLPSLYGETWGLVVNEAMACGLPVMVSRQCGCAETLVRPGQNGWTFDAKNVTELADILIRLNALSESDLATLGKRSSDIIDNWDLNRLCDGVWSATRYALSQPARHPGIVDRLILSTWKGRYRPT